MKKIILLGFVASALVIGCNQAPKTDSQAGVYKMDKQVAKNDSSETTTLAADGNTQYKIYTPGEYFYIAIGKDSSVGFGVGSYTSKDGKIVETNIYNTGDRDSAESFNLDITKSEKGYTQVLNEIIVAGKKYKLTEDYTTVATTATATALDGVWKQSKNLNVTGTDTVDATYNEYKVYQTGHFMWAAHNKADTAAKYSTYVGHGTFTLDKDALTEDLDMSNVNGALRKYNIVVTFNGTDEFTQKTSDTSKVVNFKTYKRVKK